MALGLVGGVGCGDIGQMEMPVEEKLMSSRAALSAAPRCVSARPNISDAWCQAVSCALIYVDGGFCELAVEEAPAPSAPETATIIEENDEVVEVVEVVEIVEIEAPVQPADQAHPYYPNWTDGTCVNDGQAPSWERQLYPQPSVCCEKHFSWKLDACLQDTGAAVIVDEDDAEVAEDIVAEEVEEGEEDEEDVAEEVEEDVVEEADEEAEDIVADEDAADADDDDEPIVADEDEIEIDVNVPNGACPAGWTRRTKDCSGLPWQNSVRWHCSQTLPASTTQSCDAANADLTDEMCLVEQGFLASTWCTNPAPSAPLVCGGNECDVPKAGNSCKALPAGGRSVMMMCP
jgi:hypothetical protein